MKQLFEKMKIWCIKNKNYSTDFNTSLMVKSFSAESMLAAINHDQRYDSDFRELCLKLGIKDLGKIAYACGCFIWLELNEKTKKKERSR